MDRKQMCVRTKQVRPGVYNGRYLVSTVCQLVRY